MQSGVLIDKWSKGAAERREPWSQIEARKKERKTGAHTWKTLPQSPWHGKWEEPHFMRLYKTDTNTGGFDVWLKDGVEP